MEIVFLTNFFAILFAFLESKRILKNGLLISFFILFFFLSLRYDFGNDYISYLKMFKEISSGIMVIDFEGADAIEIGWVYLCQFFKPFGFFLMIAFLAILNCYVFYDLVKKYVPVKYYWLSLFIYIINPFLFLVESSAMRQTTAMLLFLFSIQFIINRNILKFAILIVLASLFHKSAIILLLTYFIASPSIITKKIVFIYLAVFIFTFLFGDLIFSLINPYLELYFDKYSVYTDDIEGSKFGSGFGFLFLLFFFASLLYYSKGESGITAVILKIGLLYYAIYPFGIFLPMFGRIQMYYEPVLIVAMPLLLQKIKNPLHNKIFIFLILFYYLYMFIDFFNTPLWSSFNEYKTIFSY
jgi:hypothetical protein